PLPNGDVHEMSTVLCGPCTIGGSLVRVHAIEPSDDATSITYMCSSGSAIGTTSSTCPVKPSAGKDIAPLHSPWYGLFESASHQIQNWTVPNVPEPVPLNTTCSLLFAADAAGPVAKTPVTSADAASSNDHLRSMAPPPWALCWYYEDSIFTGRLSTPLAEGGRRRHQPRELTRLTPRRGLRGSVDREGIRTGRCLSSGGPGTHERPTRCRR